VQDPLESTNFTIHMLYKSFVVKKMVRCESQLVPEIVLWVENKQKPPIFRFLHDPFSKQHPFYIVNGDCYHVDIIMNCAVNEIKID